MTDDDDKGLEKAAHLGFDLLGSGVGAAVGALAAGGIGAVVGSMAGTGIAAVGREVVTRVLSTRQEARIGAVFLEAGAAITAARVTGEKIRDDGFWTGERSAGHELAEGVLLAAMDEHEERKVPYLGNLLASVAMREYVDVVTANRMLHLFNELSWNHLCIVGVLTDRERYPMPDLRVGYTKEWGNVAVKENLLEVQERYRLCHHERKTKGITGFPGWNLNLSGMLLTNSGNMLTSLCRLADIPAADLAPVHQAIILEPGEPDSD